MVKKHTVCGGCGIIARCTRVPLKDCGGFTFLCDDCLDSHVLDDFIEPPEKEENA